MRSQWLIRPSAQGRHTGLMPRATQLSTGTTTARCLVITGADPAFCSGDDVRAVMGGGERADRPVVVAPRLTPAADALLYSNVPIVAAVNGAAVGWGMELAMMARGWISRRPSSSTSVASRNKE